MIFGKLKLYAVIAAGAFLAALGAFWGGKQVGKAKARTDALQKRLSDSHKAKDVQDDVSKMDDSAVHGQLGEWMRDKRDE